MSQAGKTALLTLLLQLLITVVGLVIAWFVQGLDATKAVGFGGMIGIITTAYLALRIITKSVDTGDGVAIGGLGMTQFSKYAMIIALFYVALKVLMLPALPLVIAFAATQTAYWLVLIVFNPILAK